MTSSLEKAERIAIAALNESHQRHGIYDVMRCKFCTSRAAEMTIARHFAPVFAEIEQARLLIYNLCNAVAAFSPVAADQWRKEAEKFLPTKETEQDSDGR